MGRGAIPSRRGFSPGAMRHPGVSGITRPFGRLSRGRGQVLHVLLSRSPLASTRRWVPFDLHVLGAPPAFILSQDRTLRSNASRHVVPGEILRFEPSRPVSAMSFNSDPLGQGTRREWCYTPLNLSRTCPIVCPGCRPSRAAVSGFQGSPRSRRALCPAAARGVNIRSLPPDRCGNRRVHGSYTTRGAGG